MDDRAGMYPDGFKILKILFTCCGSPSKHLPSLSLYMSSSNSNFAFNKLYFTGTAPGLLKRRNYLGGVDSASATGNNLNSTGVMSAGSFSASV